MNSKFYTYEEADPQVHGHAYDECVIESCRSARQTKRAKTHQRISNVPDRVMPITAVAVGTLTSVTLFLAWGASSVVAMQLGAVLATMYAAGNDVRMSLVQKDSTWRRRHRIISWLIRRHPLDLG
ncbi:hypothetical protein HRW23_34975 [Streptomyces lunaelactis]|uniref:hypothetical protein n=1 Tax=Streptomyces lunaelactis TaxID=1535768 RepID=UPI0015846271|nr:hypothetical protein [Streptomyces lunaelactis]NUK12611.1 hypothetical protein [Streptomyces lunaelactis]NUK38914.1 hypothetical protein [Streptomyces lunaelactis]NUK46018.1 hypothetical protein [Streptomyces lunaelactis]NUK61982.1 hypothetical protein [Streptomyces lunaelactis]NUK71014.1 hypothetical protein [Streptomyces lunaelactis]